MAGFMELQVWASEPIKAQYKPNAGYTPCPSCGIDSMDGDLCWSCASPWQARYSAPGYLDCTESVGGATAWEAARECFRTFGIDDDLEQRSELATMFWAIRRQESKGKTLSPSGVTL